MDNEITQELLYFCCLKSVCIFKLKTSKVWDKIPEKIRLEIQATETFDQLISVLKELRDGTN